MASDYEIKKKKYDEYISRDLVNPKVVESMNILLGFANTIDPDAMKTANSILASNK